MLSTPTKSFNGEAHRHTLIIQEQSKSHHSPSGPSILAKQGTAILVTVDYEIGNPAPEDCRQGRQPHRALIATGRRAGLFARGERFPLPLLPMRRASQRSRFAPLTMRRPFRTTFLGGPDIFQEISRELWMFTATDDCTDILFAQPAAVSHRNQSTHFNCHWPTPL